MKDFFKNIQTLLIVVLIALLFFQRSCSSTPTPDPEVITKIEVRYDTIETVKEVYVPKWKTKVVTETISVPTEIDTTAILQDYYARYFYSDTLKIDTVGYAIINDTITQNTILARDIRTNILIPTTTITNTTYLYKRELFWGVAVGGMINPVQNESPINYISGELMYVNKKRNVYGFGLGVDKDFFPIVSGRLYWKIGK